MRSRQVFVDVFTAGGHARCSYGVLRRREREKERERETERERER